MTEVLVLEPFGDLRVSFVADVDVQSGVGAVERRVEVNGVVALLLVFEEDRQFVQAGVTLLLVVLTGDGPQVEHLGVLGQGHDDLVDVRQLIALSVHRPVVRVALKDPGRGVDRA